jgi:predicted phosphodiesterase
MPGHPRLPARLGLLGDLHAEDAALDLALRVFADEGVDRVLSVGDVADGRGSVDRCCARLAEVGAAVVRGNHDRWLLAGTMRELPDATLAVGAEARAFLAALPATLRLETCRGALLLCHGVGADDMASADPDDAYGLRYNEPLQALIEGEEPVVMVHGHTHRRRVWGAGRLAVINAGTLFRYHDPCFAIADLSAWEVTYYDVRDGKRAVRCEATPVPPPRGMRR